MRYLLKHHLNKRQNGTLIYIYPNSFSSGFIRLANKMNLVLEKEYEWDGKYKRIKYYIILENDFKRVFKIWKQKIIKKRKKFESRNSLEQLILVLKYIFNRNNDAKSVSKYSYKYKAYDDKDYFLRLALDIAKNIKNKNFKYGWQEDPGAINFEYVYYFQLGHKQVSFHSSRFHLDVPEFKGTWIGYRNESFPFSLRDKY